MKVLVTGSRDWTDEAVIHQALSSLPAGSSVIHGAARGADTIADRVAKSLGFAVRSYPADWPKYGKPAGMIRNREMLEKERPDLVLAFPMPGSKGTWGMVRIARVAGVTVRIFEPTNEGGRK